MASVKYSGKGVNLSAGRSTTRVSKGNSRGQIERKILLDEPTSSVDPKTGYRYIKSYSGNAKASRVSKSAPALPASYFDYVYVLSMVTS